MSKLLFENREYEVLTKSESQTKKENGCHPEERSVSDLLNSGIVVLNKPSGPTSHQAVDYLKTVIKIKKAGHSGTLDPGVTGVLPVALLNATRITNALLSAGKEYVCLMHLHKSVEEKELLKVLKEFTGTISQLPPVKSAVKRQLRKRTIYYLEVLEIKDKDVLFKVGCEAGTYIRKLVHDIGLKIGCGAHMAELLRTKAGPFKDKDMVTLQDLADAYHYYEKGEEEQLRKYLFPLEKGVEHLKKIFVHDGAVDSLCNGAFLKVPGVSVLDSDIIKGDQVAVLTLKKELILVGEALLNSNNLMKLAKGLAVRTDQVFMKPGIYAKEL